MYYKHDTFCFCYKVMFFERYKIFVPPSPGIWRLKLLCSITEGYCVYLPLPMLESLDITADHPLTLVQLK